MVNTYGQWFYERDTADKDKCDYDRIADAMVADGYGPKTCVENVVENVIAYSDDGGYMEDGEEWALRERLSMWKPLAAGKSLIIRFRNRATESGADSERVNN